MTIDYAKGSLVPKDDLTLPYIWVSLHLNATMERETLANPRLAPETVRIANEMKYLLEALQLVTAQRWQEFCSAAGMTVYGAVALSWCDGAELSQVWDAWEASEFSLQPDPEHARPARFINPALLPPQNSLKEIALIAKGAMLPFCAMIVNAPDDLEFDLADDLLRTAHPQLASFLHDRMLQKADPTKHEHELLQVWAEIIKDTEYTTKDVA